ncbi:MAG TPA: RecX family transcriptional regulator [Nitrospiraceae bacterium]|nr:RecX family transcriptional regulator [Nitrospiraceae bacterium]
MARPGKADNVRDAMKDSSSRGRMIAPRRDPIHLAFTYLSQRDRTAAQLTRYLQRQRMPEKTVRETVARCIELGYLNDRSFAFRWAESRVLRRPMARPALEAELLAKGFDEPLVAETLAHLYGRGTERKLAGQLVRQQQKGGRTVSPARLASVLRQRGFDEDLIAETIAETIDAERRRRDDASGE